LGRRKEQEHVAHFRKWARACSLFWEEGRGQEHVTRFGKSGQPPFLSPCIYNP
jgi:hypothetical protein